MFEQNYTFNETLEKYDYGKYFYTVVYFPIIITDKLEFPKNSRLRIDVWINGEYFNGALIPDKIGSKQNQHLVGQKLSKDQIGKRVWHLIVSSEILKKLCKDIGDTVNVEFKIGNQDYIEMTLQVEQYLNQNPEIIKQFNKLASGKKRSLIIPLNQAKTPETFEKRKLLFEELIADLSAKI